MSHDAVRQVDKELQAAQRVRRIDKVREYRLQKDEAAQMQAEDFGRRHDEL